MSCSDICHGGRRLTAVCAQRAHVYRRHIASRRSSAYFLEVVAGVLRAASAPPRRFSGAIRIRAVATSADDAFALATSFLPRQPTHTHSRIQHPKRYRVRCVGTRCAKLKRQPRASVSRVREPAFSVAWKACETCSIIRFESLQPTRRARRRGHGKIDITDLFRTYQTAKQSLSWNFGMEACNSKAARQLYARYSCVRPVARRQEL